MLVRPAPTVTLAPPVTVPARSPLAAAWRGGLVVRSDGREHRLWSPVRQGQAVPGCWVRQRLESGPGRPERNRRAELTAGQWPPRAGLQVESCEDRAVIRTVTLAGSPGERDPGGGARL